MINELLLAGLVLLNLLDVILTTRILKRGGYEANPLMRKVMAIFGGLWGVVKVAAAAGLGIFLFNAGSTLLLSAAIVFYTGLIMWNFRVWLAVK